MQVTRCGLSCLANLGFINVLLIKFPIPISLVHLRWFYKGASICVWVGEMSFDLNITVDKKKFASVGPWQNEGNTL